MADFFVIAFILVGAAGAALAGKLTMMASLTGCVLAAAIYLGVGWMGIAFMTAFFLLGTLTTSWRKRHQIVGSVSLRDDSKRTTGQVLANAGVSGALGVLAFALPQHQPVFLLTIAASFSAATSDTVSSELGTLYGKNFVDILSFRKGNRGENGVISLEGTFFGIIGSCIIARIYTSAHGLDQSFLWIVVAGTIGNVADSILGATVERKGMIGNNVVNLLNTAVGAAVGWLLSSI